MYESFNSKKYMILLIFICLIFTIFVIKAFDYLPENQITEIEDVKVNKSAVTKSEPVNTLVKDDAEKQPNSTNVKPIRNQKSGVLYRSSDSLYTSDMEQKEQRNIRDKEKFELIEPPAGVVEEDFTVSGTDKTQDVKLSGDELALKSIIKARKLLAHGDNSEAISEFQKVAEFTSDSELLAESYDGISELYAKNKRYSTALSFAGKAYKSSPSLAREFFIAKIYYMAGQTDTAVTRINSMLKRGLN